MKNAVWVLGFVLIYWIGPAQSQDTGNNNTSTGNSANAGSSRSPEVQKSSSPGVEKSGDPSDTAQNGDNPQRKSKAQDALQAQIDELNAVLQKLQEAQKSAQQVYQAQQQGISPEQVPGLLEQEKRLIETKLQGGLRLKESHTQPLPPVSLQPIFPQDFSPLPSVVPLPIYPFPLQPVSNSDEKASGKSQFSKKPRNSPRVSPVMVPNAAASIPGQSTGGRQSLMDATAGREGASVQNGLRKIYQDAPLAFASFLKREDTLTALLSPLNAVCHLLIERCQIGHAQADLKQNPRNEGIADDDGCTVLDGWRAQQETTTFPDFRKIAKHENRNGKTNFTLPCQYLSPIERKNTPLCLTSCSLAQDIFVPLVQYSSGQVKWFEPTPTPGIPDPKEIQQRVAELVQKFHHQKPEENEAKALCSLLSDLNSDNSLFRKTLSESERARLFSLLRLHADHLASFLTWCHLPATASFISAVHSLLSEHVSPLHETISLMDSIPALLDFLRKRDFLFYEALYAALSKDRSFETLIGAFPSDQQASWTALFQPVADQIKSLQRHSPQEGLTVNQCLPVFHENLWKQFPCPLDEDSGKKNPETLFACLGITTHFSSVGTSGNQTEAIQSADFYGFTDPEQAVLKEYHQAYSTLLDRLNQALSSHPAPKSPRSFQPLILAWIDRLKKVQTLLLRKEGLYQQLLLFFIQHQSGSFNSMPGCTENNQTSCAHCLLSILKLFRFWISLVVDNSLLSSPAQKPLSELEQGLLEESRSVAFQKVLKELPLENKEDLVLSTIYLLSSLFDSVKYPPSMASVEREINYYHLLGLVRDRDNILQLLYLPQLFSTLQYVVDTAACLRDVHGSFYPTLQKVFMSQTSKPLKIRDNFGTITVCSPQDKDYEQCLHRPGASSFDDWAFAYRYFCSDQWAVRCNFLSAPSSDAGKYCCPSKPEETVTENLPDLRSKDCSFLNGQSCQAQNWLCSTDLVKVCAPSRQFLSEAARNLGDPELGAGLSYPDNTQKAIEKRGQEIRTLYPVYVSFLVQYLRKRPCEDAFQDVRICNDIPVPFVHELYKALSNPAALKRVVFHAALEKIQGTISSPDGSTSSVDVDNPILTNNILPSFSLLELQGGKGKWNQEHLEFLNDKVWDWLMQDQKALPWDWEWLFKDPQREKLCKHWF